MTPSEVLDILNGKKKYGHITKMLKRHVDIAIGISLHTLGACPYFYVGGGIYYPSGYQGEKYQCRFNNELLNRFERESEITRNFRYANYRPLTKSAFGRITELVTGAIFQDGNYSIEISDDRDREYIWGNNFHKHNLVGYFQYVGYNHIVEDPNGYFLYMPKYKFDETPESGVEVEIWFVSSEMVKYYSDDEIVFHRDDYAYHIDKATIWRYKKRDRGNQYELSPEDANGYYAHLFGELPVTKAGGQWNSKGYYESYYDKAKAPADEFINTFSAAQMVDKQAAHPFIIEAADDCPMCDNGKIQWCDTCRCKSTDCLCIDKGYTQYSLHDCDNCNGAGSVAADPAKRKIVPIDQMKDGQLIQIITPDTSINKHHRETVKELTTNILDALHLTLIDQAQSGTAKALDQDRLHKFISNISNHMFDDVINDAIKYIIAYRNVIASNSEVGVQPVIYDYRIVKPSQFQIFTAEDLLNEYKAANDAKMPKFIQQQQQLDYVDKKFSGNDTMQKKSIVIKRLDKLCVISVDEQLSYKVAGAISTQEMQFSLALPGILDDIIEDKGDEWFQNASVTDIKVLVDAAYAPVVNSVAENAMNNIENDI